MVMPSSASQEAEACGPRRRSASPAPAAIRSKAASAGATGPVRARLAVRRAAPASPCSRPSPGRGRCGSRGARSRARHGPGSRGSAAGVRNRRRARGPRPRPRPGSAAYFTALKTRWPWSIRSPKPSGPASTAARNCRMSAPALKAGASEPITSARKSRVARASAASSADRTDGFRVFILLRISKQATPSPRSQRLACSHASTGGPASRSAASVSTPGASATRRREPSGRRQSGVRVLDREEAARRRPRAPDRAEPARRGPRAGRRASRRRAGRSARTDPPTSRSRCASRIDGVRAVGDLGRDRRDVGEGLLHHRRGVAAGEPVVLHQRPRIVPGRVEAVALDRLPRTIVAGDEVGRLAGLAVGRDRGRSRRRSSGRGGSRRSCGRSAPARPNSGAARRSRAARRAGSSRPAATTSIPTRSARPKTPVAGMPNGFDRTASATSTSRPSAMASLTAADIQ